MNWRGSITHRSTKPGAGIKPRGWLSRLFYMYPSKWR